MYPQLRKKFMNAPDGTGVLIFILLTILAVLMFMLVKWSDEQHQVKAYEIISETPEEVVVIETLKSGYKRIKTYPTLELTVGD